MDLHTALIILHIVGTVLGVGGATFIEIFLVRSLMDGVMDPTERGFMGICYRVVRIGIVINLFSGFAFFLYYNYYGQYGQLYNPILWAKMFVFGMIALNAVLLQARAVPLWLGSALSFVSWYAVLFLGLTLQSLQTSFIGVLGVYALLVAVGAVILTLIRRFFGVHI